MYLVTLISIIAVFLTYLSKYKGLGVLYKIAFIFVTILACIHYNYGTDYPTYYEIFYRVSNSYDLDTFTYATDLKTEPGWALINYLFSLFGIPFGFFLMVFILSIIQNYIYYKFIKRYVEPKDRWFAVAIYLFSSTLYVLNFSMMRQGLAVSLILLVFMCLSSKKYLWAILLNIMAVLVHTSALIFLPFHFLRLSKLKDVKFIVLTFGVSFIIFLILSPLLDSVLTYFLHISVFTGYQGYGSYGTASIGFGFLLDSMPYFVVSYLLLTRRHLFTYDVTLMSILFLVAFVATPFVLKITLLGRILYYFSVFSIVVVPIFYSKIKPSVLRFGFILIFFFMLIFNYLDFFDPTHWSYDGYKTFHTIFEVL